MKAPRALAVWRKHKSRDLSLKGAADLVGVSHVAWLKWERGERTPSLTHAIELEKLTEGAVRVEHWGLSDEMADVRALMERRAATGTEG